MVGSSVPKWGEHDNDELCICIYIYISYIYIYIMMEICYTLYSVDGNMMKYVIPLNMIFLPI